MDNSILTEKHELLSADFKSIYEQLYIHPEQGQGILLNESLENIKKDFNIINKNIVDKSNSINTLLTNTVDRLNIVNDKILKEKERLQDISMLCNKYTDFDKVINITNENITGNYNYYNQVFSCYIKNYKNTNLYIENILGNGIEGNQYVYKDYKYVKDILDTSNRKALTDNKVSTYWEYERITASSLEENLIHDFNVDSEEAKCNIALYSTEKINQLEVDSDLTNMKITRMQYSNNGIDYNDYELPYITLNNKNDSYDNTGYVYGSNLLSVPNSYYVKITLQSSGYTNDEIAYEKVLFEDELFDKDEVNETKKETTIIKSAKRHLIKINDLKAYFNNYSGDSYFQTKNLITNSKVYAIALFANVYVPNEITEDTVEFTLTVNGQDYKVIPVNNSGNGIKIIRFSKGKSNIKYTKYIDEVITSAVLTVRLKSYKNLSPYINNLKILVGGEI